MRGADQRPLALACNTLIGEAPQRTAKDGAIVVEPMGNMPVLKDLIVDMDAVHWKKVQRVVPWLLPEGDRPSASTSCPTESMIDITQSMACIHCGACVSACLSLEVDPEFVGPAALAKAYRFVGDPRDGHTEDRLHDLAEDPHGIYDCTHCFACVEVCPKDVAPMDQIMRLRRRATGRLRDQGLEQRLRPREGLREHHREVGHAARGPDADPLLRPGQHGPRPDRPARGQAAARLGRHRREHDQEGRPAARCFLHHKLPDQKNVRRIFKEIESKDERLELNLYIVGESGEDEEGAMAEGGQES